MRILQPRYRAANGGELVDDPLAAAGLSPRVDVPALACLFASPALLGEFAPASCWRGVNQVWRLPEPRPAGVPLSEVFAAAVAELCADAECVGVKLSGGLDSLAVLLHVARIRPARRIIAYTTDLIDDRGVSAASVVRQLLRDLTLDVELVVLDPAECTMEPVWSACGPRMDALPAVNATVAEHAAQARVSVLLSGDGADELLAVPRFATGELARCAGLRAAVRYACDSRRAGPGIPGELLAAIAGRLRPDVRARWYWAANWPQWCAPTVSDVVPAPLVGHARAWAAAWIAERISDHAGRDRCWMQADAFDAFWPRSYTPPAGCVAEASPFLHEDVVAAARAMPVTARYGPGLPTSYLRCKAAVVGLLPEAMWPVLPDRKQYFTRELAASVKDPVAVPLAAAAGLVDPDRLAASTDVTVRMTAVAVEQWLRGAHTAGAAISPGTARPVGGSCAADQSQ